MVYKQWTIYSRFAFFKSHLTVVYEFAVGVFWRVEDGILKVDDSVFCVDVDVFEHCIVYSVEFGC